LSSAFNLLMSTAERRQLMRTYTEVIFPILVVVGFFALSSAAIATLNTPVATPPEPVLESRTIVAAPSISLRIGEITLAKR
jgi:hypothetical protein